MIRVGVKLRMGHDQHFRLGHGQQRPQVGQQVVPGRRAVAVGRQWKRVELAEGTNIAHAGFA
ncbi:hypothetical protein D3C75_1261010 [compost metagenome]